MQQATCHHGDTNYLERELNALVRNQPATWRFLQEGSLDGVWFWDLERPENEWMSPEFWRLFGIDPATRRHDPAEWQDIIFPEDLATALENFEAHCADPSVPYDQIVRYRHADGSTIWVRCRGIAIRDAAGRPVRMLGAHNDLTSVKRSDEEARLSARAARLANADLRRFAYSVSHDMKAPANTMGLVLDEIGLALEEGRAEEARELVAMGRDTVKRMKTLVNDVLDFTFVIGSEPEFEELDLDDCVAEALDDLQGAIAARGADINVAPLPRIRGVRSQMIILFEHLIGNAIKFCPMGMIPRIAVTVPEHAEVAGICRIAVSDNGIGIPPEARDRVFELFQRMHTRSAISGTGIGLPMCQRIVENHRGRIELNSQVGSGSTFTIVLPGRVQ